MVKLNEKINAFCVKNTLNVKLCFMYKTYKHPKKKKIKIILNT